MKTHKILSLFSFVLTLLLLSCNDSEKKKEDAKMNQVLKNETNATKLVGMASIEPSTRIVSLYSEVGGIVQKINYDINSEVKAGEVIVSLNSDVEQAQLQQANSKVATQQAMIKAAKAQLASVKVKKNNAELTYNRNANLLKDGAVTQQTADDSRFNYESLQSDVAAAEATVKQREAELSEQQADINYYQKIIQKKKIIAPSNGRVLSMDVKIGTNVLDSQSIGDFAPNGPLIAITEVDELFANKVQLGMKAYVRPQGQTDTLAVGKVFLMSPYLRKKSLFADNATNMEDRRVREVRVLLEKNNKVLIGSRVECVILLDKK